MAKFDVNLYKVKALTLPWDYQLDNPREKEKVVWGFLHQIDGEVYVDKEQINPYTICRNTGIKVNGEYLYEEDLVRFGSGVSPIEIGIVVWDEYEKAWCIQSNTNFSGRTPIRNKNIMEIIGNYALSEKDGKMFQVYSDKEDAKYTGIKGDTECRSKQRLNKISKQFLPKG